jgi:hypothetical protein
MGSTVSGNSAGSDGGGIANIFGSTLTLANSTVSGNTATFSGGGIFNDALITPRLTTVQLTNSTLTNNSAQQGGGLYSNNLNNRVVIGNSIVAGNTASIEGSEVFYPGFGVFESQGSNLVGQNGDAGGFPTIATDIVLSGAIDTVIAPLADNGGATQTHALVPESAAIDAGNNALAVDPNSGNPLTTDQTGSPRIVNGTVDIGAVEFQDNPVAPQFATVESELSFSSSLVLPNVRE